MEKKKRKTIPDFIRMIHLPTILAIVGFYIILCVVAYVILKQEGRNDFTFLDVFLLNLLALAGNDYQMTDTTAQRIVGILVLVFGMVGVSFITGIISSVLVSQKINPERGLKKMQKLKNHIIICGWKKDVKNLIQDILRKNTDLKPEEIVLITLADEEKTKPFMQDENMKGLHLLHGDFTEEQTLLQANVKNAAKVLILGENLDNLDAELVDSRVFVSTLMFRNLNPKCHICAEVKTNRYKNYLEAQNVAEVVYTDAYTRYILSTATNYSGMSKVLSSFLDNGDGVSVQISPIAEEWVGKTYGELFKWYKETQGVLLLGVLENMGVEKELKHQILTEAQKSTNYGEIIQKMKTVKTLETNSPRLNPKDSLVLAKNMGAIIIGEEI